MFEQVKAILSKAVDAYHSLCTTGKWYVSNKSSEHFNVICWNCEKEECSVKKFPQPKDQKKIAANKKIFSEQKQNSEGTNGGSKTSQTIVNINGVLHRVGMVLSFLEISLCAGMEKRIVIGTLPILQSFMVLTSKIQLLFAYWTLIPT